MQDRNRVNKVRALAGLTRKIDPQKVMSLMTLHSKHFNALSQCEKEVFQKRALGKRREIRDASTAEIRQIELDMQRQTVHQSKKRSSTMSVAASTISSQK
eukprot:1695064-Amphidinium_carterae.1